MNIGFIGAGKVGCTLGRYFAENGLKVKGYFSIPEETMEEAARFTNTSCYASAEDLIRECDCIFITVPDGAISHVWKQIGSCQIEEKIICHCSGAMSSEDAFPGIEETGALGYSIHPIFPVSDRFNTYREMPGVFFTLEGDKRKLDTMAALIRRLGNQVKIIDKDNKPLYHCAAAVASNLVCAVLDMGFQLMSECGFSQKEARDAMEMLIKGNVDHVIEVGAQDGLTGPIERCDIDTVEKHLKALDEANDSQGKKIYRVLSSRLVDIASRRHPQRDYKEMYQLLEKGL